VKNCLSCRSKAVSPAIDFGRHALCNRFLETPTANEETVPLGLGVCDRCGVVQILEPSSAELLRPRVPWISCTEPEGHLDDLAASITKLPGLTAGGSICGVSFKDDSLLRRLEHAGPFRTWRIDPRTELGIQDPCAGIETMQAHLTPPRAEALAARKGQSDVVIARHVFEHASDPPTFAMALRQLVAPGGYLVIEVPDCQKTLDACDYTTVWEEHCLYLTRSTFHRVLNEQGFTIRHFSCIPYALENSLVAIAVVDSGKPASALDQGVVPKEVERIRHFAEAFTGRKRAIHDELERLRNQHGRIAIFGAGHLACTFINLFDVGGFVDCVLDDNPHKVGLYMPGSRIPIVSSRALLDRGITLCLLSIGAGGEHTVIDKHREFIARGGMFRSIFPTSPVAIGS
jgi:hypothetical protein